MITRAFLLLSLAAGSIGAQSAPASPQSPPAATDNAKPLCFNADTRDRCRRFALLEIEWLIRQHASPGSFDIPTSPYDTGPTLDRALVWDVGLMENRGTAYAFGGSIEAGFNSDGGGRYAAKARARRWLPNKLAIDGEAGLLAIAPGGGLATGVTTGVAVAYRDLIAVTAHFDAVRRDRTQTAIFLGARGGSWTTPVFTVGLAALVVYALSKWVD